MDQLGILIVAAIFFGFFFGLGDELANWLDARLQGWPWLALPIVATLSFAAFLALRPFVLDQPRTPAWFAIALIEVVLAAVGTGALVYAVVRLGRWLVGVVRGR